MAKTEEDLDLDVEKAPQPAKQGGKLKIILIVVGALVLLGGIGGGAWYFLHKSGGEEDAAATHAPAKAGANKESKKTEKKEKKSKQAEGGASAVYLALDPAFVVNFPDQGVMRFLQITVEVGTHNPLAIDAVKLHMPIIRNNLVMLFSGQTLQTISSRESKEKLRAQALSEIRKVLEEQTGDPGIENVYFTSFVMQ